ncbi:MAG: winged helix-turn-helix domain-containing protein, partial [Planctomycetota bacterium]
SAKGSETDRIIGLEVGADDYMVKPFSPRELVTRVKTVLRRVQREAAPSQTVITAGPIVIDATRREVRVDDREVGLTTTEFNLLTYIAKRPGRALKRNEMIDGAMGEDAMITDRTVDAHIAAIRRKLGVKAAKWVETIRGYGYRFKES